MGEFNLHQEDGPLTTEQNALKSMSAHARNSLTLDSSIFVLSCFQGRTPQGFQGFLSFKAVVIIAIVIMMKLLTQTSISGPKYFCPSKTSGAAYGGEPHHVERVLRPKIIKSPPSSTTTTHHDFDNHDLQLSCKDGASSSWSEGGSPCRTPKV